MNLAAILVLYFFSPGTLTPASQSGVQPSATTSDSSTQQTQSKDSQPQAEPKQSSEPAPPPSPGSSETTKPATPAKPPHTRSKRHKKALSANCSNAAIPTSTAVGDPSTSTGAGTENGTAPTLPPCPTPKKVVRNGGSAEPSIQLVGGGTSGQTTQQRTIDQLTAATTENLKKLEGRQLSPTQQDTVSQIKQFMDQSKTAVAAGDLERGNNLAMKARLLSDELVKP